MSAMLHASPKQEAYVLFISHVQKSNPSHIVLHVNIAKKAKKNVISCEIKRKFPYCNNSLQLQIKKPAFSNGNAGFFLAVMKN